MSWDIDNMNDYSFIRLKPTMLEAIDTRTVSIANIGYFDQVQLSPNEKYTQITNTTLGIAFDGNYAIYVCDCGGIALNDITSFVQISEFTDNKGVQQIAFTIDNIGFDYYKKQVLLKFVHTVSNYVWYSNLITITDYDLEKTTRFDYRDYSEFNGIAYNIANVYQSIRLNCEFIGNDSESKKSEYTSIDGIKVSSRLIETEFEKYLFTRIDNFTYRRLNKLLAHPVIYANDYRVTDKQTVKASQHKGMTNIFEIDFNLAINYSEKLSDILNSSLIRKDFDAQDFDNSDFLT